MILPEWEAREISISWSVPRPEGSLYILILPSISVTIVFIELKTQNINFSRNQETLTETVILGINKTLHRQMNFFNVLLIRIIEGVLKFLLILIYTGPKTVYRPVAPVYALFLDRSISATQSVSRNSEGHMESVQPIKCMLFILIFNKHIYCRQILDE